VLSIRAIAGASAGKSFCYPCAQGDGTYAVVFVKTWNGMVVGFLGQIEALKGDHPNLKVLVVPIGKAAGLADKIKKDLSGVQLTNATVGVPDGDAGWQNVADWKLDANAETNAYIVANKAVKTHITGGCPHCDGVAAKIASKL
jgi:hypothetical protein